jgi:hypothetical protein
VDAGAPQPRGELVTIVDAAVENETQRLAVVEQGLLLAQRLRRRPREAMTKTRGTVCPIALSVGTSVSDRSGESLQKPDVDRTT